jgi:hypothetical protein
MGGRKIKKIQILEKKQQQNQTAATLPTPGSRSGFFFPSLLLVQLLSNVRLIALNKYMTNPVQIIIPPPKNKINPNGDDDVREITRV